MKFPGILLLLAATVLQAQEDRSPGGVLRSLIPSFGQDQAPSAPSTPSARMNELASKASASFAFVEGTEGVGSAFVVNYRGKRFLFTNQHVVRENPGLKFTMLNQQQIKVGAAGAAVGHDLMAFEVPAELPALELVADFGAEVALGDEVLVIGNTDGERVIKPLPGTVAGLGPDLVEITSKFMPGNSGSPIIHVKTGRVIGIATYASIRNVDSLTGARASSVRRFGYRIDSVKQWQPVNWQAYQAEAAAVTKMHEFTGSIVRLLLDVPKDEFDPTRYSTDSRLQGAVGYLKPLATRGGSSQADATRAFQNFLGEVRNVSQRDVELLRARLKYDFFQREMAEEARVRTELANWLKEIINKRR